MRKNSSNYWLVKLDQFLSLTLLRQAQELSRGLEELRRKDPLSSREAEKAKKLIELLKDLTDPLAEIKASLIASLPRERWTNFGDDTLHEEQTGC
ncbi:MAG: hypothetical protein UX02_C0002G0072 [Candidatus Moranbacteria bacterium GW2011_GWC1_45_18]|nr:MAG: hypothetical protein UT79_C0001G0389 [Candidatus Moranbacteria bacterium GW2011_GWC2_40_12]KKT99753.1 MAG: hypothetical protein UX02_C0002G0072 [Candidatus Moranbacteria bacterium GW2011_GWC1_45_18]OGI23675.1 MAG: hypothetical protein A2194_03250 [Candidatus Moranbacteria bacterium RIFOXYA1_FULL_44_8]OGI35296.1 MAG: hypothetical protein A2407_01555 [Candidatus Moranbacteria bacterium RIFOXYC1_FULL_44_8]OGI39496.1 MAG: hypothetical protein A2374_03155 [Candidatus Moranbacteria bacterium 